MIHKLVRNRGEARLVVIMAVIAVILVVIALIPIIKGVSDEKIRQSADERYEEAARRTALINYNGLGEEAAFAYDGFTKQFVEPEDALTLTPYGNAREHMDKIILLTMSKDGEILIEWLTPGEVAGGRHAKETNR